jgi:hypothetical protein
MKHTLKSVRSLAATLITFGSLAGGANAALSLVFSQDLTTSQTTVTLTATSFTVAGLATTTTNPIGGSSTFMRPLSGVVAFSGPTDMSFSAATTLYIIPSYNFGTGGNDTVASQLSPSNPFLFIGAGAIGLFPGHESDDISNFVGTATYSGDFAAKGISPTPQTITFSNGQELAISFQTVPEPSAAILVGLGALGLLAKRRRIK